MRNAINTILVLILGTLLIMQAAFYNGYPLVYSDTGTYIFSGMKMEIPIDRPLLYGLLIRWSSFSTTLWSVVFLQSFLLSWAIYFVSRSFFDSNRNFKFILTVAILCFTTSISWYSSQLMPDIFTATSLLLLYALMTSKNQSSLTIASLILGFVLSINVHFSNLLIAIVVIGTLFLVTWKKRQVIKAHINFKATVIAIGMAVLLPLLINYSVEKKVKINQGSHVFLTGRMLDNGVLKSFLDDQCSIKNYALCYCKDELPLNSRVFLWSDSSPLQALGGWEKSEKPLNEILRGIFTSPKHLVQFAYSSTTATFSQLLQNEIGSGLITEWYALPDSPPHYAISTYFPREVKQYQQARQNKNLWGQGLDLKLINSASSILLFLSALLIFCFLALRKWRDKLEIRMKLFILVLILGIFANALVTASLANVYDRLQARVSWMLVFVALVLVFKEKKEMNYLNRFLFGIRNDN